MEKKKKRTGLRIILGVLLCFILCVFAGAGILASLMRYEMQQSSDYDVAETVFDESLDADHDGYVMGNELAPYDQTVSTLTRSVDDVAVLKEEPSFYRPRLVVRAKVEYKTDGQLHGLDDSMLLFNNTKWKKSEDGWYYYETRVDPGTKLRFIDGVKLPCDWNNITADKHFDITATVQASEAFDGSGTGQVAYEFTDSIATNVQTMRKTGDVLDVVEYEDDGKGGLKPYENDKTVTPCQTVSKVIVFDIKRFVVEHSQTVLEYERQLQDTPLAQVLQPVTPLAEVLVPLAEPLVPVAKVMGDAPVMLWYVLGGCFLLTFVILQGIGFLQKRKKKEE